MDKARVLVVDDEPAMLENCERLLSREGYECATLSEPTRFRQVLPEVEPDVLLLDLRMPDVDGMTLLTVALADDPGLPIIIMTAFASVQSAVEAIREGAFDYLTKPFKAGQLIVAVERAAKHRELIRENRALRQQMAEGHGRRTILGSCPAMVKLLSQIEKVAVTAANVLVLGESGTGKELIARQVHDVSPRSERPFVPVDCAALPAGLLESELFGHERGAFTGADQRKQGLVEKAEGGTVFLDEITELTIGLQAKLLRVLEERKIRRLGSSEMIDVDLRVIAATNVDLAVAVSEGRFREDLYFRLNVVPIHIPPLRERGDDVLLLARHFLAQSSHENGVEAPSVSPAVWRALQTHDWPGNVRELKNLIERLVVLDDSGRITLASLPESYRPGIHVADLARDASVPEYEEAREAALRAFRSAYLELLLARTDGNVSQAARQAGVSRRTLHRWLAELAETGDGGGV